MVCQKKAKLMLYSTLVEIEVEVGVKLGKKRGRINENDVRNNATNAVASQQPERLLC